MEQDLSAKGRGQAVGSEEVAAEAVWVETVRVQVPEVNVFVRVADREFLTSGECHVIRQIARNAGQRW